MDSLRTLAVVLAVLGLGFVTLALLRPGSPHPPADTLVVALEGRPRSLDPHTTTAASDFRVAGQIFEGLVRFAPGSLKVEPALAESWSIGRDGLTYVFRLRRDVRFHDGTPLNAEAVRFNFERMLKDDHPFHHTGPFPLAFFFEVISRIEVRGEHEVAFELQRPHAPLLSNLATPSGYLLSPDSIRRFGARVGQHPSGTGPWRLSSFARDQVRLLRHDGYWGAPSRLREVVFRPIPDEMARMAELRAGSLDLLLDVSADNLSWLEGQEPFRVHRQRGPHLWFVILNTRQPPFSDVRVRRAANLALNKRQLVEQVLQDAAEVASGPIPAAFDWAHPARFPAYPHDPDQAARLVREAGYPDGVDVVLYLPQGGSGMLAPLQMGTALQADLARVGIRARIETFEWNSYLARVNAGLGEGAHMAAMAWMTNDPDTLPYLSLRSEAVPPAGFNSGYFSDPILDQWLDQARSAPRLEERARLYGEIHRRTHELAPWIFVASARQTAAASRRLHNFGLEPSFLLSLKDVVKR